MNTQNEGPFSCPPEPSTAHPPPRSHGLGSLRLHPLSSDVALRRSRRGAHTSPPDLCWHSLCSQGWDWIWTPFLFPFQSSHLLSKSLLFFKHIVPPNLIKMSRISDFSRLQFHNSHFSDIQQSRMSSWVPGTGAGTLSSFQYSPLEWLLPSTPSFIYCSLPFPHKPSEIVKPLAVLHWAHLSTSPCSSLHRYYRLAL